MGNRAVITTRENFDNNGIGVYIHWNGGRDSVTAFLKYCELRGFAGLNTDGFGNLVTVLTNFGVGTVVVDTVNHLDCDNYDNGVYIVDGWEIVGREYFNGVEQNEYDLDEMLIDIDEAQPVKQQLGAYLTARMTDTNTLKVGDEVIIKDYFGLHNCTVLGFGGDKRVNGIDVKGVPYVNKCKGGTVAPENNINNYIFDTMVRIVE